jgi:streptogramin lyase
MSAIAVGPDGSVYATGYGNIQKFDANGNLLTTWGSWGSGNGQFSDMLGIAVGPDGSVFVADYSNNRIQKFDGNGNYIGQWGTYGWGYGQFYYPQAIAVGPDGSVYVADQKPSIQKFDSYGNYNLPWEITESLRPQLYNPQGIAVGPDGSVYVANTGNGRILKSDANGNYTGQWGSYGSGNGQFNWPSGITVDSKNVIYVADEGNNRIQKMAQFSGPLFDNTVSITQAANASQNYSRGAGVLNDTGKFYLDATLKNSLGQTLVQSEYPFYIVQGNTVLMFSTDKKIYKPGDTIVVIGQITNLASITASGLSLAISQAGQNLFTASVDVPAGGSYPFTFQTTAGTDGTYSLQGDVTQNNSNLAEVLDQYETATPQVTATLSAPDFAGNDPFSINITLQNTGKVDATVSIQSSIDNQTQTITIPAGQSQTVQYTSQIVSDTGYGFYISGDVYQTFWATVRYGLGASISIGAQSLYPEGNVSLPFTLTNTGVLDENLSLNITLSPGNSSQSKTYFIPAGASISDSLIYSLSSGDYTLSISGQNPVVSGQQQFTVKKMNNIIMSSSLGQTTAGMIPVTVNLSNIGYNDFSGRLQLDSDFYKSYDSVSLVAVCNTLPAPPCQTTCVPCDPARDMGCIASCDPAMDPMCVPFPMNQICSTTCPPSPPPCSTTLSKAYSINSATAIPGNYVLNIRLLDNSGNVITSDAQTISVQAAAFVLTNVPSYQTFYPGQQAQLSFSVKNTGGLEGSATLSVKAYDLVDSSQNGWFQPGEEKTFTVNFMPPVDLSEGDYFANYSLTDATGKVISSGQVKYHLAGLAINVSAALDKQSYKVGDTAQLTINIQSQAAGQAMFAKVNYAGSESRQDFTLTGGSQVLTFNVPISSITGEKLFYGIYFDTGRAVHLNSIYIYDASAPLLITTDKQVYNPSDTVSFTISNGQNAPSSGTLNVSSLNYSASIPFTGTTSSSFALPASVTEGTYNITAQLIAQGGSTYSATHPFDIAGIKVKVIACANDKGKYAATDTINTSYTINSNSNIAAILKAWIVNPDGAYTKVGEGSINLTSTDNLLLNNQYTLSTGIAGIHRLVYGIYSNGMLLASGSQAFDVGDAVLLGISTDKTDYPSNTEPVNATVNMTGSVNANLELQLDGNSVNTSQVILNEVHSQTIALGTVSPGNHTLQAILTAGGLTSTKTVNFAYGSDLPDLVIYGNQTAVSVDQNNMAVFQFIASNQGRTPSTDTTAAFYLGGNFIATNAVGALAPGASQEVDFSVNVLGKAGAQAVKAVIDPDNKVVEFNKNNNTYTGTVTIPDATIFISTSKYQYIMGKSGDVGSNITNLTTSVLSNYNLRTVISSTDTGAVILDQTSALNPLPAAALTNTVTNWNVPQNISEGTYNVNQYVSKPTGEIAASSAPVQIQIIRSDFQVAFNPQSVSIKQGQKATYSGLISIIGIFNSPVALSVAGLPQHISYIFNPGSLVPPGSFEFDVLANDQTETGTYPLTITGSGGYRTHQYPLSLDISAFSLTADNTQADLKQLDSAVFNLSINSLNGYQGAVSLNVSGAPFGTKISLDQSTIQAPGSAVLTLYTSKYARPGTYELTVTADDGLVKHVVKIDFTLELNPDIAFGLITAEGPGPNNPAGVRVFNSNLASKLELNTFSSEYGANVVSADIDGDGYDEIVVAEGPGPNNSAAIRAYKRDGTLMGEWTIADAKYGLTLAAGDLDGDWRDEIVVGLGPDPQNPATVYVLKYQNGAFTEIASQNVYPDLKYGVNVAVGDVDGDGIPEIITAPGPGPKNPALITVWKLNGNTLNEVSSFTAFNENYGANIAAGDVDGDGKAEIIVGNGPDPKNAPDVLVLKADGTLTLEFAPYESTYGYGTYVAATDLDEDGLAEIVTGLGPGPQSSAWVKVFKNGLQTSQFLSYPQGTGYGVKVFLGRPGQ